MRSRRFVLALLAALAIPGAALGQSPSASIVPPSPPPPSVAPVPVVGFDGTGDTPSTPMGPQWSIVIDRPFDLGRADAVRCGDGAVVLASGTDRRNRSRALVYVSPDGATWRPGADVRPGAAWDDWDRVQRLVRFRGATYALGGDGRRLAVWRSTDCGDSWTRIADRGSFHLGRRALGINGIEVAATTDRMLIIGRQGGEELQSRAWAWMVEPGGAWRRIPARVAETVWDGLTADADSFAGWRSADRPGGSSTGHLMTSADGSEWRDRGPIPGGQPAKLDVAGGRFLAQDETTGPGFKTIQLVASPDGAGWTPIAESQPVMQESSSAIWAEDGVLVWLVDVTDALEETSWSWVAVSADGGTAWTASAGWPEMRLRGLHEVAVGRDAVALITSGERFDHLQIRTLPR